MLRQINFPNFERCYPRRLKKIFQSNLNMRTYDRFIPNMERAVVGNIPPEIIKLFPKKKRADNIKEFQIALADISEYLRNTYFRNQKDRKFSFYDENYKFTSCVFDWMGEVTDRFNTRTKKILKNVHFQFQYVGRGDFGNVFKVSLLNKKGEKIMHDKALKVYFNIFETDSIDKIKHGNYAEANFWTYLRHAAGHKLDKTQFTKHYISDLKSGYSLTEFIDRYIVKTTDTLDYNRLLGLNYFDGKNNRPYFGKLYDAGGFSKNENFTGDRVVLRYFKKLFYRSKKELPNVLSRLETLAQNPKTPHRDKIQQAIDLFEQQNGKKS